MAVEHLMLYHSIIVLYIFSIQLSLSSVSHDFRPLWMATPLMTKVQEFGGRFRRSTRGQHSSQLRYAKKLRRKICLKAIFFVRNRQVLHCFSLTGWFWMIQQVPKPDSLLRCNWACFLCGLKKAMTFNRGVCVSKLTFSSQCSPKIWICLETIMHNLHAILSLHVIIVYRIKTLGIKSYQISNKRHPSTTSASGYRQLHIPSKPKTEPHLLYWITWVQTEGFQNPRNRDEMLNIWILR